MPLHHQALGHKASYGFTIFQVKSPEYSRVSTMFSTTFSRYFSPKAYKNCVECSNIQLNCTDLIGNFNSTVERCHFEFIHSLVRIFMFPLPFLQCTFSILIEHFGQEVTILSRLGLQRQMVTSMNHRVFAPPPIYGKYVIISTIATPEHQCCKEPQLAFAHASLDAQLQRDGHWTTCNTRAYTTHIHIYTLIHTHIHTHSYHTHTDSYTHSYTFIPHTHFFLTPPQKKLYMSLAVPTYYGLHYP